MLRATATAAPATKAEPQFLEAAPVGMEVGSEVSVCDTSVSVWPSNVDCEGRTYAVAGGGGGSGGGQGRDSGLGRSVGDSSGLSSGGLGSGGLDGGGLLGSRSLLSSRGLLSSGGSLSRGRLLSSRGSLGGGGGDLSSRGGGLIVTTIDRDGSGVKTAGLGSSGQTGAVVPPDVELESALEAAVEEAEPLLIVAVAALGGALERVACTIVSAGGKRQ